MAQRADKIAMLLDDHVEKRLAGIDADAPIPRILHQTFASKTLPDPLAENTEALRARNSGWDYRLWDDGDIERFIAEEYGAGVLERYRRIAPGYGAARADLFRYLLIYRLGGVYLDIKSTTDRPLDEVLGPDDRFIVSQWDNGPGGRNEIWGLHPDLADIPGGEFQQWFIASVPGHPFLRAVIERVLSNIDRYNPYRDGVGLGVVRVTGPVAYTFAIAPLLNAHPHRRIADESVLGLRYSVQGYHVHHAHFRGHYSTRRTPIVGDPGGLLDRALLTGYLVARRQAGRARKLMRRIYRRLRGLPPIRTL